MIFIDTNIAIALRDVDRATHERVQALGERPVISLLTRIELENGVGRHPDSASIRRRLLDRLLETLSTEMFIDADIHAYRQIVEALGYDRQRTIDRLIAAQAIARGATLITRDRTDFGRITGLSLEVWETP